MEIPPEPGTSKLDASFSEAAERFLELIRAFGTEVAGQAESSRDGSSLARKLADELERWLRTSSSTQAWYGPNGGFGGAWPPWPFAALPIGPRAEQPQDSQRTLELLARFAQLQAQLALHWSEIARNSAEQFAARLGASWTGSLQFESVMRLYGLWIECAERAYADSVRKDEFCRLQAELANTATALLLQQRKQAETLARAFGMPTRTEVDALHRRLRELQSELRVARPRSPARPKTTRKRPSRSGGKRK